jgi:hypothetical protein
MQDSRQMTLVQIGKDGFSNWDTLRNCVLLNRKSDANLVNDGGMMISPRPGTVRYGDRVSSSGKTNDLIFYTGHDGVRRAYKTHGTKVYKLVAGVWTDIGITLAGTDARLSVVRLPAHSSGTPTEYTSLAATAANRLKPDAADTSGLANVRKWVFVTPTTSSSTAPDKFFRFFCSEITNFDAGEYVVPYFGSAGIIAPSGLKYRIYDSFKEYLQITSNSDSDKYYNGTAINSDFTDAASYHFRIVAGNLPSTYYVPRCVDWAGYMWSYYGSVLAGAPSTNPFNFELPTLRKTGNTGEIVDLFQWKSYLGVGASDYVGKMSYDSTSQIFTLSPITRSHGMKKGSAFDGGGDAYYLSTNNELWALPETYIGVINPENVGSPVQNYLKDMNVNCASGFDGRYMYVYGEKDGTQAGVTCVFDVRNKWWYHWDGSLRPTRFVAEQGITYVPAGDAGEVDYFSNTVFKDRYDGTTGTSISQEAAPQDIDSGNIFIRKGHDRIYFWLDNYDQDVRVRVIDATIRDSGTVSDGDFHVLEKIVAGSTASASAPALIGGEMYGEGGFDGGSAMAEIAFPNMWSMQLKNMNEHCAFKIIFSGIDGSPFYLNALAYLSGANESADVFPAKYTK